MCVSRDPDRRRARGDAPDAPPTPAVPKLCESDIRGERAATSRNARLGGDLSLTSCLRSMSQIELGLDRADGLLEHRGVEVFIPEADCDKKGA